MPVCIVCMHPTSSRFVKSSTFVSVSAAFCRATSRRIALPGPPVSGMLHKLIQSSNVA